MNNDIRIKCPSIGNSKGHRISELFGYLSKWVYSAELSDLIGLFGGADLLKSYSGNIKEDINMLNEFSTIWDYRKGKERWEVKDESFVIDNRQYIMERIEGLGLLDITKPVITPDYLLPLGGARLSNYDRPQMARKVADEFNLKNKYIVALSGARPISEIERPFVDEYATDAKTEYEAINAGLERAFNLKYYKEDKIDNDNINLCSAVRAYCDSYEGNRVFSLAAPSTEPEVRRANSYDTFNYFLERFRVEKGSKLLLVTSCIYVPFQLLKFVDLAIEGNFEVDCIGSTVINTAKFCKPSNYLQEVKATLDAIFVLSKMYL